jgi:hypothetical protein
LNDEFGDKILSEMMGFVFTVDPVRCSRFGPEDAVGCGKVNV